MTNGSYTISELAQEFEITTRTIRFYEEKGLLTPRREGQKRLYSASDRARIVLILRGKRIGMTLLESAEFIDMYDPEHNNTEQLHALINNVKKRREKLLQQQHDISAMLGGLEEVQALCESTLSATAATTQTQRKQTGTDYA